MASSLTIDYIPFPPKIEAWRFLQAAFVKCLGNGLYYIPFQLSLMFFMICTGETASESLSSANKSAGLTPRTLTMRLRYWAEGKRLLISILPITVIICLFRSTYFHRKALISPLRRPQEKPSIRAAFCLISG